MATQRRKTVVVGLLGSTLDAGNGPKRWQRWRPTVALCQHEELVIDRLELLHQRRFSTLYEVVEADLRQVSPETEVRSHVLEFTDPWELEEVYGALHDFARQYPFRPGREDYLIHITTGTHIAQICMFLLTESRYFPARLIQTSPPTEGNRDDAGTYRIIDLDLSKYDRIASRFRQAQREGLAFLKAGIDTKNEAFNRLMERVEQVAAASRDPLLLMGPTGAGKSKLAQRIYELKRTRRQVEGAFVDINCATVRGDSAMSALFGHVKGAFTSAVQDRPGLLRKADGGVLFLDEIGELGLDEQAMLLGAIENKVFYPVGSDRAVRSDFQLIAGTNRDLNADVGSGRFREDLLARINLWTFRLPALRERPEDIEPNLDYEIMQCAQSMNVRLTFSREARERFLRFATSADARWTGNFRDLNAAVRRMATLCTGGRISVKEVEEEIERLRMVWRGSAAGRGRDANDEARLQQLLGPERFEQLDYFDQVQLEAVVRVCEQSHSLSDAGRTLFAASRLIRKTTNDADRLRKYLARFELSWNALAAHAKKLT